MRNNPYVGPRPYEREDRKYFHGRNREARDLLSLILAERIVLFYAPSGAGKTSLLNAQIIPSLEDEGFIVLPKMRVGSDVPPAIPASAIPNIFTFSALMTLDHEDVATETLKAHTLTSFLEAFYPVSEDAFEAQSYLLVFDQFEELFTTHQDRWQEAEDFFKQIDQALNQRSDLGVVFTMREDYVAELDPYAQLLPGRLRARFRMDRLSVEGALEAAKKPAQQSGCPFDPGVAEQLVDNLRRIKIQRPSQAQDEESPAVLGPLIEPVQLQVVCRGLWENLPDQEDNAIQWEEVEKFGDIDRALINFYEDALVQTHQQVDVNERKLRRWFGGELITPLQTRGLVLRGEEDTNGLPNTAVDILDELYLIHAEVRAGARWYELSHDRLVEPITQSNSAWEAARQTPLRMTAKQWAETKNPSLLYQEQALKEGLAWIAAHPNDVEPYEQEFLEVSQQVARAKRRARQLSTIATGVGFMIMAVLTFLGWIAGRNGLQAYSRELAAQSRYQRTIDQTQSILLARAGADPDFATWWEGSERSWFGKVDTTDAEIALRQSLTDFYPAEIFKNLGDQANGIAFSSDGRFLYAAFPDHGIWIRDLRLGSSATIDGPSTEEGSAVWSVTTSPDGRWLAVSGDDGAAQTGGLVGLWDITTHKWVQRLKVPTPDGVYDEIYTTAFSPDGRYLATGGDYDESWRDAVGQDGLVRIWTLQERGSTLEATAILTLTQPEARVHSVAFGQKHAFSEEKVAGFVTCPEDMPDCMDIPEPLLTATKTPDTLYLAAASHDHTIYIWEATPTPSRDLETTLMYTLTGHTAAVRDITFSPSENLLASASEDRTVRLWDLNTGKAIFTLVGHTGEVTSLAFSANGQYLISGSRDRTVHVWDGRARNPNATAVLGGPTSVILDIAFSPDGQYIAAGSGDQSVRIWDLDFPRQVGLSTLIGHEDRVRGIAYSPDGKFLVSGDNTGAALLWSMTSGDIVQELPAIGGKMWGLAYSPDGGHIVTCSEDAKVRIWDPATGTIEATLEGHTRDVEKAAFSSDGDFLVTVADDHKVLVWNTETWELEKDLPAPDRPRLEQAWAVAYSPDGQWIAAGRAKGAIHLWKVDPTADEFEAAFVTVLAGHTTHVMSLDFSADSQYLASGSWDNTLRIWDLDTYEMVGEPLRHPGYVYSADFSPDGFYLATGARDGKVRIWDLEPFPFHTPELIAILEGHTDLIWSIAFSPDSQYLASASWDGTIRRYLVQFEDVLDLSWDYAEEDHTLTTSLIRGE